MKAPRYHGVDLAYGLLLFFVVALGTANAQNSELYYFKDYFNVIFDGALGAFLFLNAFLLHKKSVSSVQHSLLRAARYRAIVILILGVVLSFLYPDNLLLLIGICMLIGSVLCQLNTSIIITVLILASLGSYVVYFAQDTVQNTSSSFIINRIEGFLYTGKFSVLPWVCVYLVGLFCSRMFLFNNRRTSLVSGFLLILIGAVSSVWNGPTTPSYSILPGLQWFFPSFLIYASGLGVLVWTLFGSKSYPKWTKPLSVVGSMRYTVLVLATFFQSIMLLFVKEPVMIVVIWQLVLISIIIFVFIYFWRKQYTLGPVERMFRSQQQG
ncbi:MAG: hypothetical protein AAF193_02155 [Bacteroidota bacterium]